VEEPGPSPDVAVLETDEEAQKGAA
jgi:hypothetical protein